MEEETHLTHTQQLMQNGLGPKKVLTDAGTVHQFDLDEQIMLDKYRRAVERADNPQPGLGVKLFKFAPGGTPW